VPRTPLAATLALALPLATVACEPASSDDDSTAADDDSGSPPSYPLDDVLRVNHLQAKGTHNSYHLAPPYDDVPELNYSHVPIPEQLESQGVRKVELDVWYDASARVHRVLHIPLVDEGTTCELLADCLEDIAGWSETHPGHHPIFVQIEPKDQFMEDVAEVWFEDLEAAILATWPATRVIAPDDVLGEAASLAEAVATFGWPTLGEVRGKVLFFLNETGDWRDFYTYDGSDLHGRLVFVDGALDAPYAVVNVLNDPIGDAAAIADALARGHLVRTRTDPGVEGVEAGDLTIAQAALASGAQVLSTDYPVPHGGSGYVVEIPGGTPSRCNPVTAPPECTSLAVEDPDLLAP